MSYIKNPIEKQQKDLTFEDFFDGQKYKAELRDSRIPCEGVVTIENGKVYLCQNETQGDGCSDKKGYAHSYRISAHAGHVSVLNKEHGLNVYNLVLEKPVPALFIQEFQSTNWYNSLVNFMYLNIVGLEDNADERIMMNFTGDLEFIDFSKQNGGPIFRIKDRGQSEAYWQKEVIEKISAIGGMTNMITDLSLHQNFDK